MFFLLNMLVVVTLMSVLCKKLPYTYFLENSTRSRAGILMPHGEVEYQENSEEGWGQEGQGTRKEDKKTCCMEQLATVF